MVIEEVVALDADTAVEALFARHYSELLGLARLLLDDRSAAEEVVQEAFARYHVAWRKIRDPAKGVAYLRSIVCNEARGRLRRRAVAARRTPAAEREVAAGDDSAIRADERRMVMDALRALPRRQRECMVLRYWGELSEAEIADALVIARGSVKSHIHRAMAALTIALKELR